MTLRLYDAYIPTGSVEIPRIPAHWDFVPANVFTRYEKQTIGPECLNGLSVYLYSIPAVQEKGAGDLIDGDEIDSAKLLIGGETLIVSKLNPRKNTVALASPQACLTVCSTEFVPLRPAGAAAPFLFYLFSSHVTRERLSSYVQSVTRSHQRAEPSDIYKLKQPLPPPEEQRTIAAFLDHETARIDRLIEKQQRLIELLKEKRQAAISHAVTKGLDPDAPMKDSGVEWLGEVPDHWQVVPFKHALDFREGPGILAKDFRENGVPLLRIGNLRPGYVELAGCNWLDRSMVSEKWAHFRVRKGDLLISASASTGLVSEVDDSSAGSIPYTGIIIIRPSMSVVTNEFAKLILASDLFFQQVDFFKAGATIQHFGPTHLRQMTVLVPPLEEQSNIVRDVAKVLSSAGDLIEKARRATEKLEEHRSALINAAVTGQIDVRGWQPPEGERDGAEVSTETA